MLNKLNLHPLNQHEVNQFKFKHILFIFLLGVQNPLIARIQRKIINNSQLIDLNLSNLVCAK